ncbi:ThuA domain-containing protein [Micromonospora sp. NPDC000207]|uniref:ThuA domain-containing protein n=1 Tax=Micromonospora sp. NPDC000207 TaxID=3154246 RepID=UPI0033236C0F
MKVSTGRRWLAVAAGFMLAASLVPPTAAAANPELDTPPEDMVAAENGPAALRSDVRAPESFGVLVFTKTAGERRASIRDGSLLLRNLGKNNGFDVTVSEDANLFTADELVKYRAIVFLNTSGDILNSAQEAAFEEYIKTGGGFVGIHSAAETEPDWQFYQDLIGAKATGKSSVTEAVIDVADRAHPATETLPRQLQHTDQWYNFSTNVRGKAHVLATLDEASYTGGTMGFDHPITWCQDYQGGRSFYTGLGHTGDTFRYNPFRKQILGGIRWAAGVVEGDCGATVWANYEKVTLNDEPGEPMNLSVLPDGRVLHSTRGGEVRLYDPATGASPVITTVPVYTHDEDGLQYVTIGPDFAKDKWVYIYYSPKIPGTNEGTAPVTSNDPTAWDAYKGWNQLSRVKFVEDPTPRLDLTTEQQILRVDVDRGACCHVAGEIRFDGKGLLYLVTGDDTNAAGSDQYTPILEMPTQGPAYDAQRSSANTNDLRGKVIRIKMKADGTYSIPRGNLFPEGTEKTRPEIFLMGLRNPFRFDVSDNGFVYIGDYSPDARVPHPDRGPEGTGRWIATNKAGNYGWPYCNTPDQPYIDFDFATRTPKGAFDCAAPINDSPRNTGLRELPKVEPVQFWYTFNATTPCPEAYLQNPAQACDFKWPVIGTGGVGPMGGPIYKYDRDSTSEVKFPEYYDNAVVFGEFTRDKFFMMRTNGRDRLFDVESFVPNTPFSSPMDMEFGPDGSLYVLEYGKGFFRANPEAQLSVIRYVKGTRAPVADLQAGPTSGQAPLTVNFDATASYDPDPGESISFAWDFTSDGTVDSADPVTSFTYTENGTYTARLTVTDSSGKTAVLTRQITVGNTAPTVTVTSPIPGSLFNWGDEVPYVVTVTDPEDGTIDCSRVTVTFVLGHDDHGHPDGSVTGCTGTIPTPADGADHAGSYLYGGLSASYTDLGGGGQGPLTGTGQTIIQLYRQQAEFAQIKQGVGVANTADTGGGQHVNGIDPGDHIAMDPINLGGVTSITLRHSGGSAATAGQPRAQVELRLDAPDGPLVGTANLNATTGNNAFTSTNVAVNQPAGSHKLYFVFRSVEGGPTSNLFNFNWVNFNTD